MAKSAWRGGDAANGFEILAQEDLGLIRLRFWGLWDDALGATFGSAVKQAFGTARQGWAVLADISNYPPQRPTVQAMHAEAMKIGQAAGIVRSANLVSSALGKLQIKRLSEESGLPEFSFFIDEKAALAWLRRR